MERISHLLQSLRPSRHVPPLAEQLVAHTRTQVWQRVRASAGTMTESEARGYLRAHARQVMAPALRGVLNGHPPVAAAVKSRVVEAALDTMARQLLARFLQPQPAVRRWAA